MSLNETYRITQYDPAHRDSSGAYVGDVDDVSDEGPLEAAYLDAVEAFARELGVTQLEIRDPSADPSEDYLDPVFVELFGEDLTGFTDGALVDIATGRLLVRAMLRGGGSFQGWCRLEAPDMTVHVGFDVYMFITTSRPCPAAVSATAAAGLFPEHWPGSCSPYAPDEPGQQLWRSMHTPIDDAFWARIDALVHEHGAVLIEERATSTRWHRLTPAASRPQLRPRCRVWVWPDLTTDIPAVRAHLNDDDPDNIHGTVIWQTPDGPLRHRLVSSDAIDDLRSHLLEASRAQWRSNYLNDLHPIIEAVMPDRDGVIRARWEPLTMAQGTS